MSERYTRAQLDALEADRGGCVQLRYCQATGTLVGVYRSRDADFEDGPECRYQTVCEDHGETCAHRSQYMALRHASRPDGWCSECQAGMVTDE